MASVRFEGVWKDYGEVTAVRDLNLTCAEGEMLALLGPSGCGKSTSLKMAAGIEGLSRGEIYFGDRPVSRLAPGARNIAMVFEDYALYPHLSVRENIDFPLKVRGAPAGEARRRVQDALDLLGLGDIADRGVRGLSGGAQQRVAIGRALVRDPALVLFDEPLSHLDADQKVQLRGEIKRLQKISQVTSILVTHDQTEATAMADRIAVMRDGVLQQVGTPQDLYERPANLFVANFIGEPPMNLLPAALDPESGDLVLEESGWRVKSDGAQRLLLQQLPRNAGFVLGIRPEHVELAPPGAAGSQGVVDYREPRGDRDVVVLDIGAGPGSDRRAAGSGHRIVAEIPGPSAWKAGDRATARIRAERIHLFAAESTRALAAPPT